jgi:hypothetical protein
MPPKRKRQANKAVKPSKDKMQIEEPIDLKIETKIEEGIVKENVRKRTRSKKEELYVLFSLE